MSDASDPLALDPLDPPAVVEVLAEPFPAGEPLTPPEPPIEDPPPDPLTMNIEHLVAELAEAFEEGHSAEVHILVVPGVLERVVAYARDLEDKIAEPIAPDELRRIRHEERERLAVLFETNASKLRSLSPDGSESLPIEMLAFLLRLDHQ